MCIVVYIHVIVYQYFSNRVAPWRSHDELLQVTAEVRGSPHDSFAGSPEPLERPSQSGTAREYGISGRRPNQENQQPTPGETRSRYCGTRTAVAVRYLH